MKRALAPIGRSRQAGFSLIEMVAAFLIFAIGMAVLMQILATSMHSARTSSDYTMAALWAESKLDVVGVGEPIEAGSSSGRFDDTYSWQLDIKEVDPSNVEPMVQQGGNAPGSPQNGMGQPYMTSTAGNPGAIQNAPFDLYQVDLTVSWGGRFGSAQRTAHFSTLRAMNPEPNNPQGGPGLSTQPGAQGVAVKR